MTLYLLHFFCDLGIRFSLRLVNAISSDIGHIQLDQLNTPDGRSHSIINDILLKRRFKCICLDTLDACGSYPYEHHKPDDGILALTRALQPDKSTVLNMEQYFQRPQPIGWTLRIFG